MLSRRGSSAILRLDQSCAGSWGVFLKPVGEATWQKGDAFCIMFGIGSNSALGSEYHCKLQWDEGNNNRSISWGFGDMLSRWLERSNAVRNGGIGYPDIIVLRLLKVSDWEAQLR